jgi:ATP-dependent Clp protease ATP-binding subunit ClpC
MIEVDVAPCYNTHQQIDSLARGQLTMGILNPKIPTPELSGELQAAGRLMRQHQHSTLTPEMLLLTFIRRPETAAHRLLVRFAEERGFKLGELEGTVETMARMRTGRDVQFQFIDGDKQRISLSKELINVLDEGLTIANAHDQIQTGPEHVLAAMAQSGMTTSGVLQRYGLTPAALDEVLAVWAGRRGGTSVDYVALARAGEMSPLYERSELLQELAGLLSLAHDRHVILIGAAGVGKRSLVYSLALQIAEGQGPPTVKSVVEIAEQVLVEQPVKALEAGLRRAEGGVLMVPHIHRFFGGRLDAEFYEAGAPLRQALLSDGTTIVGTTDQANFDRLMVKNTTVQEHSHVLKVPPASLAETVAILGLHRPGLERDYDLQIDAEALDMVASLAQRTLSATPLPGSAMHLIHRTAAALRAGLVDHREDVVLDSEDVMLTASQMTGIPVSKLGTDERTRYARMVEHLHERIIGQEEAVLAVSRAVKTARVGLKDPKRPIGSFLFLGPTGVGKTELAKALAEFMFGDEDAAVELDMSEYQQEHSVNRLIGAPPGYVGYESGGQLTDAIHERPYSVVLFDEAEKAHPRVADVLLQIMEEGRLTDGQGRTALFNEAVIILTSNLGSEYLVDPTISEAQREVVMDEVRRHFRPEFLNRLDDIILFHPLSPDQLRQILDLMLKKEHKLAAGTGIAFEVTDAAKEWLLAQNDHPEWGARPLRRILRRYLREPLADSLLQQQPAPGTAVLVGVGPEKLTFEPVGLQSDT